MAHNVIRFSRFALVGAAATVVHYSTAIVSSIFLPIIAANPLGFLAAVAVSYFGHMNLTFSLPPEERRHATRLPRFLVTAVAGFLLGQAIVTVLSLGTAIADWLILAIAVGLVPVFTYAVSSMWVFATSSGKGERVK